MFLKQCQKLSSGFCNITRKKKQCSHVDFGEKLLNDSFSPKNLQLYHDTRYLCGIKITSSLKTKLLIHFVSYQRTNRKQESLVQMPYAYM